MPLETPKYPNCPDCGTFFCNIGNQKCTKKRDRELNALRTQPKAVRDSLDSPVRSNSSSSLSEAPSRRRTPTPDHFGRTTAGYSGSMLTESYVPTMSAGMTSPDRASSSIRADNSDRSRDEPLQQWKESALRVAAMGVARTMPEGPVGTASLASTEQSMPTLTKPATEHSGSSESLRTPNVKNLVPAKKLPREPEKLGGSTFAGPLYGKSRGQSHPGKNQGSKRGSGK